MDGMSNSTIIQTNSGFYEIYGSGFKKIEPKSLKSYFIIEKPELLGQIINEAKSDLEYCTLHLSSGDFITHHVDTGFLIIDLYTDVINDQEYLDYFNNSMQRLTNVASYAKLI
jgi:hypothetical protein